MTDMAHSLRKATPESLSVHQLARTYREAKTPPVKRIDALRVAKASAAAMGLGAAKIALLDLLFASSKPADWETPGRPPIVWPSNAMLARKLGVAVNTVRYHLRGLVHARLVAHSDHPTYQRRGRRDEDGQIAEAYGIDLSPIAVRFDELSAMAETAEHRAKQWKRYSDRRTCLRKEIRSILANAAERKLAGAWDHLQARLDVLRERRPCELDELVDLVGGFEVLRDDAEALYGDVQAPQKFDTAVSKYEPLLTTADLQESENSKDEQRRADARRVIPFPASGGSAERKSHPSTADRQPSSPAANRLAEDIQVISLPLIRDACPVVSEIAPDAFKSWHALRSQGGLLCTYSGINPQVWREAQEDLGPDLAIAAMAVTVQRATAGSVAKPGAYLRRLVQLGREGELHLSRSLFAMAKPGEGETVARPSGEPRTSASAFGRHAVFPSDGSIYSTHWGAMVRSHAPAPTPDLDVVAQAFRSWARQKDIGLDAPGIEKTFIGFCKQWKSRR